MTRKGLTTILDTTRRPLIIIVEAPVNNANMEIAVRAKGQQKFEAEPATKKVKFDPLAKVYSAFFIQGRLLPLFAPQDDNNSVSRSQCNTAVSSLLQRGSLSISMVANDNGLSKSHTSKYSFFFDSVIGTGTFKGYPNENTYSETISSNNVKRIRNRHHQIEKYFHKITISYYSTRNHKKLSVEKLKP